MPKFIRKYYLAVLVWWNYRQRAKGLRPDEWYWADAELLEMGYAIPFGGGPWPRKF